MNRYSVGFLLFLLWITVGCTTVPQQEAAQDNVEPAPTINTVFSTAVDKNLLSDDRSTAEGLSATPEQQEVAPTLTPLPTLTPKPTVEMKIVKIFGDTLHEDWSLQNSRAVDYDLNESAFVYEGSTAISYKPNLEYADLAFTVNEDANDVYLRDKVLAVRFWLYSVGEYVNTDALLVSVVGSNDFPYWVADDNSVVTQDSRPVFPATRLYYLNVEEDIPPDTWFQVELWLNDLIYDPQYEYVTGIYIKNDENFFRTIYIDDVELLVQQN
ncbi:MAG: hypothetical protein IAF02_09045 [Anaerolineae bacterium]|nr:hypothetical protein [Anaerolineae bacterium]